VSAAPTPAARIAAAGLALADALAALAALCLLGIVAGAILGRLLFDLTGGALDATLPGAIELARFSLMGLVVSALPGAAARGLVRVDLLADRLPPRLAGGLERLWGLGLAAFGGLCAWLLGDDAALQLARGDATQDLRMPLWPFTAYAALGFAGLGLVGLGRAFGPRA